MGSVVGSSTVLSLCLLKVVGRLRVVNLYARIAGIILVLGNAIYLYDQTICRGSEPNIPERRVLVIGIDGVRPDALQIADTPAIDELISAGAFTNNTQTPISHCIYCTYIALILFYSSNFITKTHN